MSVNQLPLCRRDPRDPKAAARYEEQLAEAIDGHKDRMFEVYSLRMKQAMERGAREQVW